MPYWHRVTEAALDTGESGVRLTANAVFCGRISQEGDMLTHVLLGSGPQEVGISSVCYSGETLTACRAVTCPSFESDSRLPRVAV